MAGNLNGQYRRPDRSEIGPYLGSRLFQGRYFSEICPVDPFRGGSLGYSTGSYHKLSLTQAPPR